MRMPPFYALAVCFALLLALPLAPAHAADDPWPDIKAGVFEGRAIAENDGALALYAPEQAEDAALVPIAVHIPANIANQAKSLTLIIDRNPAPVAATFRFGDGFHASSEHRRAQADDARAHRCFLEGSRRARDRRRQAAYGDQVRHGGAAAARRPLRRMPTRRSPVSAASR